MRIENTKTIYRDDRSYCGPISMVKLLRNGDLAVVFREADWEGPERRTHAHPSTRTSLIRSTDGGQTWSDPIRPDPRGGNGTTINQFADGMILVSNFRWTVLPVERRDELKDRRVVRDLPALGMAMSLDGCFRVRSYDNGESWERPRPVRVPDYEDSTTAGRAIELEDKSLLMPMNGSQANSADSFPWVARSTDRGETWSYRGTCGKPPEGARFSENRILPLPDGRILSMVRTPKGNYWRSHSADGGRTWSGMEETPLSCMGSSPADPLLLQDGRVLCTYGRRRPEPKGVRACLSEDGGDTWELDREFVLRDDAIGADMGYPSTEQLPDGRLLTVYYWHEADQVRHLVGTWWSLD